LDCSRRLNAFNNGIGDQVTVTIAVKPDHWNLDRGGAIDG
jgi:hypothetical protein